MTEPDDSADRSASISSNSSPQLRRVVFTPSGLEGRVADGTTVLDAAREIGADLDTVCGGRGICGRCQVVPGVGSFPKWSMNVSADALSEPAVLELDYHGKRPLKADQRLGCSARVCGDVILDIPPESQIHKQVVRKEIRLDGVSLDPTVVLRYIEVPKLVLGEDMTATGIIQSGLADQWDMPGVAIAPRLLPHLHAAVEADVPGVTLAVSLRPDPLPAEVTAIWAGFADVALGIAVDIGSTTVAGHLCDLATGEVLGSAGRMNPQIRFGEDLMSRVSYVMMNPGGDVELTAAIREALTELLSELLEGAGASAAELLSVTLVGNPIMHHLVLGIDPTPLGAAPFLLGTSDAIETPATALDLPFPNASVYLAPCIAGHVGADTAAAIVAEGPHRSNEVQLLVDIGTNAEIVLGSAGKLFAASSPTGPAFEGAQLSCGVRASAGAIERVRINPQDLEPRFKVIGSEHWSDTAEFIADQEKLGIIGVCGSGIIEVLGEMFLTGIMDANGVIQGSAAERTDRVVEDGRTFSYVLTPSLRVTQNDVRAIQLAKAALRAGIDLLREHAGLTDVSDVRLAGAFGAHIDPAYALLLGLVPPLSHNPDDFSHITPTGNSAGNGAVRLLLSASERREIEHAVATEVTKIETATEPRFQELFVDAMAFPHASMISSVSGAGGSGEPRRRRRRTRNNAEDS